MKDAIAKRPLLSFFILSYLFSWLCWVPLMFGEGWDQNLVTLVMFIGVLGPMAAAIIVSRITKTSKLFWQSTLKWRVSLHWHLAALGIPLVVLTVILAINHLFGVADTASALHTAETEAWYWYPVVLLVMVFIGGGLEEPGWRGFAQARMLARFTPFTASIILGVTWTYWHAPLLLVPGSSQQGIELGWYTAGITSLAVIMTWLFIKSDGSALLAIVFHGGVNAINEWIPPFNLPLGGLTLSGFAVMESVWIIAAIVILVLNRELFFRKFDSEDTLVVMRGNE